MTKDGLISLLVAVILVFPACLIDGNWLRRTFENDPVAAVTFTCLAVCVGYFICSIVHWKRAVKDGQGSERIAEAEKARDGAEVKYQLLLAQVASGSIVSETGLSPEDVDDRIGRYLSEHAAADEDVDALFHDDDDAAKLGTTAERVRGLEDSARRILREMTERDAEAFRSYCSKCIAVLDGNWLPTWPCNSASGIPAEYFPQIAIDMGDIDRLAAIRLVSPSKRIPIPGRGALRIRIAGHDFLVSSVHMFTIKATGERTESAFFYPLTDDGIELAALCDIGAAEGFADSAIRYLASNSMQLVEVESRTGSPEPAGEDAGKGTE